MELIKHKIPDYMQSELGKTLEADLRIFGLNDCVVMVGSSSYGWHISISGKGQYPTWDEIKFARDELSPDKITMVMYLPPKEEYVNVEPNTFHLWEQRPQVVLTRR